ncbi:unnamed protein product [Adineta steineri]|uniref:(S)-2-hydroxy-acid oxidase n=3 Tax=Adineta steineri TaxID=433720 RepID=A0A819GTC7_9BILA|nr:unnamed protein product [Adineta steineri]CAF3887667.1 unnamed protein product [Adineta steineri]
MQNINTKSYRALLNIEDYHQRAKEKLSQMAYDYYSSGSDDQITLTDNQEAFRRIKLRPKILIDVSENLTTNSISCKTQILNSTTTISFPFIIAPTAFHRLANDEHGELATVRAAVACSTIMCVSTMATIHMEAIANEHQRYIKEKFPQSQSQLWYQLYVFQNRQFTQKLIEQAERCGYKALVLTVDSCAAGNRESTIHSNFSLPDGIQAANLIDVDNNEFGKKFRELPRDSSLSWKDLDWIRSITSLPLILKGIMHPDDAITTIKHGIQGIIISNHGGRQLDSSLSTIDALSDIIKAIGHNHQIDIYVDGGVRRGTDILKAIALGAKAVLIGRPVIWGLAVDGEQGVRNILEIFQKELNLAMMLCGCQTIADIKKNNLLVMNDNINRSKL